MFQRYLHLPKEAYIATLASAVNHIGNVTAPFLTLILSIRLGFSIELTATLISAKTVLQLVGVAIGGITSDRYSRKTVLRWGGFLAVTTYLLMALNTHRPMLVLGMLALNSLAQAAIDPAIEALLIDVIPHEHQRDTAAMKYFGLNVGFTIGPLLAAALYKNSLPILFLVDGGTLLIALLLIHFKIEETYRKSNKKQRVKLLDLFANRSLMGFSVAVMLVFVVFFQYNFGLPLAVKEILPNNGDWLYGSLMSLNAVVVVLFTFVLNHLLRNFKIKTVLLLGVVFYALGFGMYGFANGALLFLIGTFLWSIGEILVSTGVNPMIYELTEPSKRGKASALFPLLRRFAAFTSPLAGGWIVANLGFTSLWIFCVLILGVAALFIEFSLTT